MYIYIYIYIYIGGGDVCYCLRIVAHYTERIWEALRGCTSHLRALKRQPSFRRGILPRVHYIRCYSALLYINWYPN